MSTKLSPCPNFIGGEWLQPSGPTTPVYNPSTGDVIDTATRRFVAKLQDEQGNPAMSEKLLEIDSVNGKIVRVGNQFGVGRVPHPKRTAGR